ncbi:KCMB3 protein, partial [Amia calva]|nr:KCMB3 protein [Amia calva]
SRGQVDRGNESSKTQAPVSSAGEDRAILLGISMMGFSVLMFFVFGITLIKPFLLSNWSEETNCTVTRAEILKDWVDCTPSCAVNCSFSCGVDCQGPGHYPCLQVFACLSSSGQKALLHYDDQAFQLNSECFYVPRCLKDEDELLRQVREVKRLLLQESAGGSLPCRHSPDKHPHHAILRRKYQGDEVLRLLQWPALMVTGGALIVALVRLNQYLARLCSEICGAQEPWDRPSAVPVGNRLYQILTFRRSMHAALNS